MAKVRLNPLLSEAGGALGDVVLVGGRGGQGLRARPTYRCPMDPDKAAGVERLKRASALWNTLNRDQAMAWNAYAESSGRPGRTGHNVFLGLAIKLLQIDPASVVPLTPPDSSFIGDDLQLTVRASPAASSSSSSASRTNAPSLRRSTGRCCSTYSRRPRHPLPAPSRMLGYAFEYHIVLSTTGQASLPLPPD